jgi:hypothetical protein
MTTATDRAIEYRLPVLIPVRPAAQVTGVRRLTAAAVAGILCSIIVMIVVSLNPGYWLPPRLAMPAIGPPWSVPWLHIGVSVVTVALWLAALVGAAGVAAGLLAIRRGARVNPWLLIGAGLATAAIMAVLPPAGSTDILDYATFGHIVTLGHTPYVWTPYHLRVDGSAFGADVPGEWDHHVTLYGPLATFEQFLAATLGGSSMAKIVFWLKLWNAIAFAIVAIVADRLVRADPAARLRLHLLWTVNPLLLWGLIEAGHVDMIAAGAGLLGLLILGTGRVIGVPGTTDEDPSAGRAVLAGLFLGAAADVKIDYIIFLLAAAWPLRRSVRPLLATVGGAVAVLLPTYLWFGPPAVQAVLSRTTKVTADNFYQLFSGPTGFVIHYLLQFSLGSVLILAVLTLWRMPAPAAARFPALRPALALSCAWLFVWPYQLPWYDAMIVCLLIFYPASQLDWLVLIRLAAGTVALSPGDPFLRAGWLINRASQDIVTVVTPVVLLGCAVGLAWLCLSGRWRFSPTQMDSKIDTPARTTSVAIPVRT